MTITITKTRGNWTFGTVGGFDFEVKHYEEPSEFGIESPDGDTGRISKLWIGKRSLHAEVASYDRGWDTLPILDTEIEATDAIIARFN